MNVAPNTDHPAKWSKPVLDLIARLLAEESDRLGRRLRVVDLMAGVGRTHDLDADTVTGDLELEWAACRRPSVVADAAAPPFRSGAFDAYVTSPTYGSRMADHHENRDSHKRCGGKGCPGCKGSGVSPRKGYKFALGRQPHERSTATLRFGPAYQRAHEHIYAAVPGLLRPGGLAVVNASNFVRNGTVVPAVEWHLGALRRAGLVFEELYAVPTQRMRHGTNREARVPFEHVIVMRSAA